MVESVATLLKQLRSSAGLSQEEVAQRSGLSVEAISALERGVRRRPRPHTLRALAIGLGLSEGDRASLLRAAAQRDTAGTSPKPAGGMSPPEPVGGLSVPAQLPHDIGGFVGRAGELRRLHGMLAEHRALSGVSPICVISGAPGVGKTALAVHFAHQVTPRFPDGQLYVDLRSYDAQQPPLSAHEALGSLLRGLGVPAHRMSEATSERSAQLRSLLATRRMLILADNAGEAGQVRPLLPAAAGCLVIVTSRHRLGALAVRDGAQRLALSGLSWQEALALLAHSVGADRVRAEPDAAAQLVTKCAFLPLALRIVAERLVERLAARPGGAFGELVRDLRDERERLDTLTVEGDDTAAVRAVFSGSYHALTPEQARMFRLLGLHAGTEISTAAAAALAGTALPDTRRVLDQLIDKHLLDDAAPDRHHFHDLLRIYAAERAQADEPAAHRAAAVRRMLRWYLHSADAAGHLLTPRRVRPPIEPLEADCPPASFPDWNAAVAWCESERANLVAAVHQAMATGDYAVAWQLAVTLWDFFNLRKHWSDWLDTTHTGLEAARALGDRMAEAWVLGSRGIGFLEIGRIDESIECHHQAMKICRAMDNIWGVAISYITLGNAYRARGDFNRALDCPRQALAIFRDLQDRWGEGMALNNIGEVYADMGRIDDALAHYDRALAIRNDLDDQWGKGFALHDLGAAHLDRNQPARAARYFRQALTVRRAIQDRQGEARTLDGLATALHTLGKRDAARRLWLHALAIYDDLNDPAATELRTRLSTYHNPTHYDQHTREIT